MQPYLPIVRVFLLLAGAAPDMRELRERLIQRVEAALRAEGVTPSAIGERSDAVLRTAAGERSDAVLRTVRPAYDE